MTSSQPLDRSVWVDRKIPVPWMIGLTTFGILALELALIRWSAAQVRAFAYFSNVVLICAFLGLGLGLGLGRRRAALVHSILPMLAVLAVPLAFAEQLGLTYLQFPDNSVMLWGAQMVAPDALVFARNMGIFLGLLALVVGVFLCAGAALGELFGRMPPLRAYHADLLGSLGGVIAFTAAAWLNAGPAVWLALGCAPFVWLAGRPFSAVAALVVVGLGFYSVQGATYSPYNRIDLLRTGVGDLELRVNRDFHQYMFDFSERRMGDPTMSEPHRAGLEELRTLYDLPFSLNERRGSALVVGAGTGNDVQAALRNGYAQVTSVDIDGRIIDYGRQLHPESPYAHPGVRPVVDDARAYFERARDERFDVVCFGLLDSHAMSSAMSTLRLDNFVYTADGIRAGWNKVAPGGHLSLALSCFAGRWFYERLYWTITEATGREPISFFSPLHGGTVTFVVPRGDRPALMAEAAGTRPTLTPLFPRESVLTTSDDWPYLYLRPGVIPWGYLVGLGAILLGAALSVRKVYGFGAGKTEFHLPLFLMGAAFLLIETRGVTSLSLLFGSTWVVNSAVFAGILAMVIVANWAVQKRRWNDPRPWFAALFAATLLLCLFPVGWLHTLPLLGRGIAGGLLTGLPIGIAGVLVPMFLARARDPAGALGANLIGSVVGGCLEYYSMLGGLRATALLALVLYLLAYLAMVRRERAATALAAAAVAG